ncbi:MAG: potassium channel family protein [Muribaculaceae bacterium]
MQNNGLSGGQRVIFDAMHIAVLVLSLALIVYISYDTFNDIPFLQNKNYMNFQLCVCIVFLLDFFLGLYFVPKKWQYFRSRFLFFFVSIPFLNIINQWDIQFTHEQLYFIRFIPLARGAYALSVVVGYASKNKISSMLASYLAIMVSSVYFASLIFFESERNVNPSVTNYGEALWWACMNVTTLGAPIVPVTDIGKVLCVCLGGLGMMMFPLFTVYITTLVTTHNNRYNATMLRHLSPKK